MLLRWARRDQTRTIAMTGINKGQPILSNDTYTLRQPDDLVLRTPVIEDMITRSVVVRSADEADFLLEGMGIAVQDDPARCGGDVGDGLRGTSLWW